MRGDQFKQMQRVAFGAGEMERQPVERQLGQFGTAARLQPDAQRAAHVLPRGERAARSHDARR